MSKTQTRRLATIGVCVAAAVALFAAYHHVRAQDQGTVRPAEAPGRAASPSTLNPGLNQLAATYFSTSTINHFVKSSYQPLDPPQTIMCDNPGGCTIGVEQHVQLGLSTSSTNGWATCTQVDGVYIGTPGCAWQGFLPADNFYHVGAWAQQTSVPFGNHTVQTFIYTTFGAQEDDCSIIYRVYNP